MLAVCKPMQQVAGLPAVSLVDSTSSEEMQVLTLACWQCTWTSQLL